jgi:signal transduction histidine kinase
MQVQVVLVLALFYLVFFVIALAYEGYFPSRQVPDGGTASWVTSLVLTFLPLLSVALAGALFILAVVLPPTVLFAYLLSRRTTRRLETLTAAAARLREGDYDTPIEVQGEDEIAQLQADFNAMAADLREAMRDLQVERDKVEEVLRSQRELVASVSHELRTPVATVWGYLQSGRASWGRQLPAPLTHDLAIIENEVARLQGLIDDLFTLSRVDAGGLVLDIKRTDASRVVQRQVEALAPLAWQSSRVEVTSQLPLLLPPVMVDEARLEQVLGNLIRNGVQHTLPGGIVTVVASVEEDSVQIELRDTGEGITPEDLPHIWDRFYQGRQGDEGKKGGAGLGLALVKELTEAMGGTVSVESTVGQGSCFTVTLPRPGSEHAT